MGSVARFDIGSLFAQHGILHFVETGTGRGESLAHASRYRFRSLASCEIEPSLADAAASAFAADVRVRVCMLNSVAFLEEICTAIPQGEPILFWLDAHFPGGDYGLRPYGAKHSEAERLPLRKELATIARCRPNGRDVVIVDDLRIWVDGPFEHGNLPAGVRPFCPKLRDASLFGKVMGATHGVEFDYRHEGYVVMRPLESGPPTLLGPEAVLDMLRLARSAPPGDFVEVGVYKGGSAWHLQRLAAERGNALHLFDTFTGIPERTDGDEHRIGDFSDTSLEAVQTAVPSAVFHPGVFPATMVGSPWRPGDVAFVHVDCDQRDTIAAVIATFEPLLCGGGIMLFDDYGALDAATKVVDDMLGDVIQVTGQGKAYYVKKNPAEGIGFTGSFIGIAGYYRDDDDVSERAEVDVRRISEHETESRLREPLTREVPGCL